MRRHFHKLGLVVSLSAIALVSACGPSATEKAEAPPTTTVNVNAVADAPAATTPATNVVVETPAAAVPAATATATVTTTAPAAGAMVLNVKNAAGADMSGDATNGAAVFRQCQTCHVKEVGVNKVGPSMAGIVGRAAGTVPGFRYSEANKGSGITWTEQELYVYLENPKAKIPGTTMAFAGIKDSQKRADLIAYLKTPV